MNAISPIPTPEAAERRARHLRFCQEMQERGMVLMRLAADRAEAQAEPAASAPEAAPAPTRADPNLVFTRLCRTIGQAMLLEERIATGPRPSTAATPAPYALDGPSSQRRMALRRGLDDSSRHHADKSPLRRALYARMDAELATDTDNTADLEAILIAICTDFGLTPDFSQMPDEILDIYGPPPETMWTTEEFIEHIPLIFPNAPPRPLPTG